MATLELRNVNKTYGAGLPDTLKNIELEIDDGEFLILVGPSGCGKSTLMNCIAGLETISGGAILIGRRRHQRHEPERSRHRHGVPVLRAVPDHERARQHRLRPEDSQNADQADIDEEVARVAKLLQIEHLLSRKPGQLSGGQQQRVAMGRALARRPKIYLFDEPLSNLDAKLRVEMRTEMKLMHQRLKTTTVYVTHDQIEAMTLATMVAVMKDGIIQQLGTPQDIYNNPANLFVASFIGSPPMNFIPLRLQRKDGRLLALLDSGQARCELPLGMQDAGLEDRGSDPRRRARSRSSWPTVKRTVCRPFRADVEVTELTGPDTLGVRQPQ